MKKIRIMFVCLGNICRSPLAHGIFEKLVADAGLEGQIEVKSSGTSGYHRGEKPDPRMNAVAASHGFPLEHLSSQQITKEDLNYYDLILSMDKDNHGYVKSMISHKHQLEKVKLFRDFDPQGKGLDVPDPYYGGPSGFDKVYDIAYRTCHALLGHIKSEVFSC